MRNLITKLRWTAVFASALLLLSSSTMAEETLPTTHTLEELVSRLVNLKKTISAEKKDWREDEARLEGEYELLQKEKRILEDEIRATRSDKTALAEERAELIVKKDVLTEALDRTLPDLKAAEAGLKRWRKRIPSSLLPPLEPLFDRLDKSSEQSVSQRLQVIFSLYGEIEGLQHDVRVTKEILPTKSGREREFDVIYLGLARGFCVSGDNREAGIGRPAQGGWEWEWSDGLADSIRRAMDYYNREKSAGFIKLPLKIVESAEFKLNHEVHEDHEGIERN